MREQSKRKVSRRYSLHYGRQILYLGRGYLREREIIHVFGDTIAIDLLEPTDRCRRWAEITCCCLENVGLVTALVCHRCSMKKEIKTITWPILQIWLAESRKGKKLNLLGTFGFSKAYHNLAELYFQCINTFYYIDWGLQAYIPEHEQEKNFMTLYDAALVYWPSFSLPWNIPAQLSSCTVWLLIHSMGKLRARWGERIYQSVSMGSCSKLKYLMGHKLKFIKI